MNSAFSADQRGSVLGKSDMSFVDAIRAKVHHKTHAVSINRRYNSRSVCVTVNQVFVRPPIELETTPKCVDRGVRQPTWDFQRLNPHGYGRKMRAPISVRVSTTVVVEQKQRNLEGVCLTSVSRKAGIVMQQMASRRCSNLDNERTGSGVKTQGVEWGPQGGAVSGSIDRCNMARLHQDLRRPATPSGTGAATAPTATVNRRRPWSEPATALACGSGRTLAAAESAETTNRTGRSRWPHTPYMRPDPAANTPGATATKRLPVYRTNRADRNAVKSFIGVCDA
jgi:hypothetical protein